MNDFKLMLDEGLSDATLNFTADELIGKYKVKQRKVYFTALTSAAASFAVILILALNVRSGAVMDMMSVAGNFLSSFMGITSEETIDTTPTTLPATLAAIATENKPTEAAEPTTAEVTETLEKSAAPKIYSPTEATEALTKPATNPTKAKEQVKAATQPPTRKVVVPEKKNHFIYEITEDDTAEIIGYKGNPISIVIPSEIDGYKVTAIGDWAFCDKYGIEKVIISEGITKIGNSAFSGTDLKQIILPDTLKEIGRCAFEATEITSVKIPDSVETISEMAFKNCKSLTEVTIGKGIKAIMSKAFDVNENLTISGYIDTATFNFAHDNNIKFINLGYANPEE